MLAATGCESKQQRVNRLSEEGAVESLIELLRDKDVCLLAADALIEIGKPAVEPLIGALKDRHWRCRSYAAEALRWIGDTRAIGPLIEALKDEFEFARGSAAHALRTITKLDFGEVYQDWKKWYEEEQR